MFERRDKLMCNMQFNENIFKIANFAVAAF